MEESSDIVLYLGFMVEGKGGTLSAPSPFSQLSMSEFPSITRQYRPSSEGFVDFCWGLSMLTSMYLRFEDHVYRTSSKVLAQNSSMILIPSNYHPFVHPRGPLRMPSLENSLGMDTKSLGKLDARRLRSRDSGSGASLAGTCRDKRRQSRITALDFCEFEILGLQVIIAIFCRAPETTANKQMQPIWLSDLDGERPSKNATHKRERLHTERGPSGALLRNSGAYDS